MSLGGLGPDAQARLQGSIGVCRPPLLRRNRQLAGLREQDLPDDNASAKSLVLTPATGCTPPVARSSSSLRVRCLTAPSRSSKTSTSCTIICRATIPRPRRDCGRADRKVTGRTFTLSDDQRCAAR